VVVIFVQTLEEQARLSNLLLVSTDVSTFEALFGLELDEPPKRGRAGCTDELAANYDARALVDDGTCVHRVSAGDPKALPDTDGASGASGRADGDDDGGGGNGGPALTSTGGLLGVDLAQATESNAAPYFVGAIAAL